MPWCAGCDRFLSPSTVTPAGRCPRCGTPVDPGRARGPGSSSADETDGPTATAGVPTEAVEGSGTGHEAVPLPWHFKLLVGAIALYLGWRAVQGVAWLLERF
jgi:hypothetical protein